VNANEFTWKQRGAIDFTIGVSYGLPPDTQDLVNRQEWEEGWQEAFDLSVKRVMLVTGQTRASVLRGLQGK